MRGYRENVFVRDQAVITSIELRIPVLKLPRLATQVSLAPFFDYAYSWNKDRPTLGRRNLASPGIGLRVDAGRHVNAELYWGYAIWDVEVGERDALQDHGVHFLLRARL